MTSLKQDIQNKLQRLNSFEKIITINVAIFIIGKILQVVQKLPRGTSLTWFELPSDFFSFLTKPWTIISYGFIHYDFIHLFFNIIVLYFVAQLLENLFKLKLTLNVYFLGIIVGGFLFLLAYNILPENTLNSATALVGASAGVRALLIFLCAYMPNKEMRFFTFNIKLWYLGVAMVAFDFLGLFGANAGGNIAHLGGALLGYVYAKQLHKGNDIGTGFEKLMDTVVSWFYKSKKGNLKTVHKSKKGFVGHTKKEFNEFNKQKQIDIILDKISKSGYESLTKQEKEFLFKAGSD
jgi:membrane associated rhomboid family serine protease